MSRYNNIHTHLAATESDCTSILNVMGGFGEAVIERYCSMGLHPWHLTEDRNAFESLKKYAGQPQVIAVGECGLDKIRGPQLAVQEYYFRLQIRLASELRKPLILHCVRAFEEVLKILQEEKTMVPIIFHGFRKKQQLAEQILRNGYLLSFGAALINNPELQTVLANTPANQFFLETDDASLSVKDLYRLTAEIRKTDEEAIILQLQQNFKNTFGI